MITQNLIQSFFWAATNYDVYNLFEGKDLDGMTFSYRNPRLNNVFNINSNVTYNTLYDSGNGNANILYFGTGTKEASTSDYKLQSPIEGDVFTPGSASTIHNKNYPGNYTITQSYVYTGDTDVTITEVGLINSVAKGANSSDGYSRLLMIREVLENPITVSKGQQFVVTMTIS